jgi:ribonuclease HI
MSVELFTDGSCNPNPGPGGWGAILRWGGQERELYGGQPNTTNNQMEMTAVLEGLRALKRGCVVTITTDSQYVIKGMTEWMDGWVRRKWRTATGEPVKNADLWQELVAECDDHEITWVWVKGHKGHPENERADKLADFGRLQSIAEEASR